MTELQPPSPNARLTGLIYLAYFLTAIPGGMLMKQYVTSHDAAITASAILAHEDFYRLGVTLDIGANALYLALTVFLYHLLKPAGARAALLFAFFSVIGCSVQLMGDIFQLLPLVLLKDSDLATAFGAQQLQILALISLKVHSQAFSISLTLFGAFDVLIGWLIIRSGFTPRALGLVWVCAGLGWLLFLWPPLATQVSGFIIALGMLAEVLLMLWLLVAGVNVSKWRECAQAARDI